MKFILGTKQGMTQIFDDAGNVHAATVISVAPATVTQVKTNETDGYTAIQIGTGAQKPHRLSKAVLGHFKKSGNGVFRHVKETRVCEGDSVVAVGDSFDASVFTVGDSIVVSGITKGKGFQGVVKRHNFAGGPRTHGQKHSERSPGSIGAQGPQRVFKGRKMPGRMGSDRVSVKNLRVLAINPEKNQLLVSGAVPGRRGTVLEIRAIS